MPVYHYLAIHYVLYGVGAGMIILHQHIKIKDYTFIYAVVGFSSVKDSLCDKDHVSGMICYGLIIKGQMERAGDYPHDLIMGMPVVGHLIPGAQGSLMVVGYGEIKGSLFSVFNIIRILHSG